jgi:tryptophan halogenase
LLAIDENEFIKKTQATFKLGIEFVNWRKLNHSYIHPFGSYGEDLESLAFHNYWIKLNKIGKAKPLENYSLATVAARNNKFSRPISIPGSPLAAFNYAYQFDAGLYAKFLREYAEKKSVRRVEGEITHTQIRGHDGFISAVTLASGQHVEGDFFIDCSGFKGLLIAEQFKIGYVDWSHWLPCDSAIAVPCTKVGEPTPYTRSTAHTAGWQWRIPLQHRTGNGHVFSSKFMHRDEATEILLSNLDGEPIASPKLLTFTPGRRDTFWVKNCVAVGLSSGFLEPLESTSIHLIQTAISKIISLFPSQEFCQAEINMYNNSTIEEYERIRDFLILHYKATERDDSAFWNYCRNMEIPEYLQQKISLYENSGRIYRENEELFGIPSWLAVMDGQGLKAKSYHPIVEAVSTTSLIDFADSYQQKVSTCVGLMPTHQDYLTQFCQTTCSKNHAIKFAGKTI